MKSNFFSVTALLFILLSFFGCCEDCNKELNEAQSKLKSCQEEMNQKINEKDDKTDSASMNSFSIIPAQESDLNMRGYGRNLHVIGLPLTSSETTVNCASKKITLKMPLPNNKFEFYDVFDVSSSEHKAILYILSDNTTEETYPKPMTHLLTHEFTFGEVGKTFNLVKDEVLNIYVLNDMIPTGSEEYVHNLIKKYREKAENNEHPCSPPFAPKEACGGVITGG